MASHTITPTGRPCPKPPPAFFVFQVLCLGNKRRVYDASDEAMDGAGVLKFIFALIFVFPRTCRIGSLSSPTPSQLFSSRVYFIYIYIFSLKAAAVDPLKFDQECQNSLGIWRFRNVPSLLLLFFPREYAVPLRGCGHTEFQISPLLCIWFVVWFGDGPKKG